MRDDWIGVINAFLSSDIYHLCAYVGSIQILLASYFEIFHKLPSTTVALRCWRPSEVTPPAQLHPVPLIGPCTRPPVPLLLQVPYWEGNE